MLCKTTVIHCAGFKEVAVIEAEQNALAKMAGAKNRNARYAERGKPFSLKLYDDEAQAKYTDAANAFVAQNSNIASGISCDDPSIPYRGSLRTGF